MAFNESPDSYLARKKIKEIFKPQYYEIKEEVELEEITNNMEEKIWPPYRADMLLSKVFILEFDSKTLHGTRRRRIHDRWRDKNIKGQLGIPTVRLISKDILQQTPEQIMLEINHQLGKQKE